MADTAKRQIPIYQVVNFVLRTVLRWLPSLPLTEKIALWWGYKFGPEPGIIALRSGARLRTTHVDHLQLLLYYLGTFEPYCLDAMRRQVKPGDTILDVGANIGLFTVEGAAAVGSSGRVISIEAVPSHASSVAEAVRLNNFDNVDVIAVAVGDVDGEATLTLPRDTNFGMFTLGAVSGDESLTVPVRRIDDILAGRKVDFIKMDIEGSEYLALLGAEKTLSTFHPTILIELNEIAINACGSSSRQVKELLMRHGYSGRYIIGNRPVELDHSHICDECLFVHRSSP